LIAHTIFILIYLPFLVPTHIGVVFEARNDHSRHSIEPRHLFFCLSQKTRLEEKRLDEDHDRARTAQARAAMLMEREQERMSRELNKQQANENVQLMHEQKALRTYMDKDVYTNSPTSAYFMQWNTSTR